MSSQEASINQRILDEYESLRERLKDPRDFDAQSRLMELDDLFVEEADWFGKTGLDEDTERRLAPYIRMEYGETVFEDGGLKASDLEYIGCHPTEQGPTHFWKMPSSSKLQQYAMVVQNEEFDSLGFGRDLLPPEDEL